MMVDASNGVFPPHLSEADHPPHLEYLDVPKLILRQAVAGGIDCTGSPKQIVICGHVDVSGSAGMGLPRNINRNSEIPDFNAFFTRDMTEEPDVPQTVHLVLTAVILTLGQH